MDATPYGPEPSGAKRRALEILARLPRLLPDDVFEAHWAEDGGGPPPDLVADNLVHVVVPTSCRGGARRLLARAFSLARRHRQASFTHLLVDHGPVVRPARVRNVVTVHDLRFLHGWSGLARGLYGRLRYGRALRRAHAVVAVSSVVRDELVRAYRLEHVVLARNAAGPVFRPRRPYETASTLARLGVTGAYVLVVARDEPRKSIEAAVAAWREAAVPALGLVVAGARGWTAAGVVSLGHLDAEDLAPLYASARWTLVPSVYEGYSLPVAESLACGAPVVATDIPAHRAFLEEGAQGLVLVPPPRRWRRAARRSWPEAAAALRQSPPAVVAGSPATWDAAAAAVAACL